MYFLSESLLMLPISFKPQNITSQCLDIPLESFWIQMALKQVTETCTYYNL